MRIPGGASRRALIGACFVLAGWAGPARAEPPRLLLRADFDREPSCLSKQIGSQPGAGGRGSALLLPAGAECLFPAEGHLDPRAGTLSFWVRPHDWNDGEGRYQAFFDWSGTANGRPFQLYVDSPAEKNVVRVVVAFGADRDPHQTLFQIAAPATWQAGRWQKVDVTWDAREIVLYSNGKRGEYIPLSTVRLPDAKGLRLRLTPSAPGAHRDATVIDEVEIWDAAFPADRIAKRFEAAGAPPLAAPRLRAPHVEQEPVLDGALDDAAWRSATRVPMHADAETGYAALSVPHVSAAWSRRALHLALEAPLTAPDDAFDVAVLPATGGSARSFRLTARGLAGEDAESPVRIESAAKADGGFLRAELSVPFTALGVESPEGALLRVDVAHRPDEPGVLTAGARLADAVVTLGDEREGVRIEGGPELALGRVALAFERSAGGAAEVELARASGRPWRQSIALGGRKTLDAAADPPGGVLRIAVRDDAERHLAQLESRIGPIELPGLRVVPEPEARHLVAELDLRWLDGSWLGALAEGRATARLLDRRGRATETHDLALESGRARVELPSGLEPGVHRLALELRSGSRVLELPREVEVPPLPWLGEKVGEPLRVLEPWTPLAFPGERSVGVWGRVYELDGPLLAGATSQGKRVLREPMRLVLRTQAGESRFRTTSAERVAKTDARAEYAGAGAFEGAGVDARWTSAIEFDGFVTTSVTLVPKSPQTRVEGLVLELPLEPRIARYLRGMQHRSTIRRGRTPWDGRRYESSFEPFVWLSDEKEGFLYVAESAANWVGSERKDAVVVEGGPRAGITLRLIGEPVVLPGPVTYTLGFQATPVKPLLPKARSWNFGVAGTPTPNENVVGWYDSFGVADGVWQLERPVAVEERERVFQSRAVRPFYYGTTSATPDHLPAFKLFEPLWRSAWSYPYQGAARPANVMRSALPNHRLAAVCPGDPSYQARMLHDAKGLVELNVIGVYTDTDEVFADDNERHGCGYHDAFGRSGVSWTVFSKRRFAQRLATVLRDAWGERRYWMSHAHTRLVPPVHGFADFWYPGEELTGALKGKPWLYMDGLDDEYWRIELHSGSSGIVHVLLPELSRGDDQKHLKTPQPTESMVAMAAVNDVIVSSAYANAEVVGEYWGLRKKLELIDAAFVGHWEPGCPVRAVTPRTLASVYETGKGPVVVVTSRTPEPRTVEVTLDLVALDAAGATQARDARSGASLPITDGRVSVPLAGRSYTYLTLRR
jgi:hypothetical protein